MIGASVKSSSTRNVGEKVGQGVRNALLEAADAGFAKSQDEVPDGATSGLRMSGFEPGWMDGRLVWGYSAEYARFVEEGTGPHYPPIEPLKQWARRVLGDEDAAYAVQQTIGQEGTPAQPFVEPGFREMVKRLRAQGISSSIDASLD